MSDRPLTSHHVAGSESNRGGSSLVDQALQQQLRWLVIITAACPGGELAGCGYLQGACRCQRGYCRETVTIARIARTHSLASEDRLALGGLPSLKSMDRVFFWCDDHGHPNLRADPSLRMWSLVGRLVRFWRQKAKRVRLPASFMAFALRLARCLAPAGGLRRLSWHSSRKDAFAAVGRLDTTWRSATPAGCGIRPRLCLWLVFAVFGFDLACLGRPNFSSLVLMFSQGLC